jgi:hypothetical protein
MSTSSSDRKNSRYRCNQKMCVRYTANGQKFMVSGRCTVVNKTGIGASVAAELVIGQEVLLEIALNKEPAPRRLKAQVRNRQGSIYGFQFVESDERTAAYLAALFNPESEIKPAAHFARSA